MNKIEKKVKEIIDEYETSNPFEICEKAGIIIMYCDLPECVKGLLLTIDNYTFIQINRELEEYEKRVVCAHELGHYFLHESLNIIELENSTNYYLPRYEREADIFCAYLLIDKNEFIKEASDEQVTTSVISVESGVPVEIVELIFAS